MKVDTGNCASCGAKNSKFVEKCYKCKANLPWSAGYHAPLPPAPVAPARPAARTVVYSEPATIPPPPSYSSPIEPATPAPQNFPPPYVPPSYAPPQIPPSYAPTPHYGAPVPLGPLICQACGYNGHAQTFTPGSTILGVILCLVWLLPGICYFIWQSCSKYEGCPQCKGRNLVPLHSPQGQFCATHFYGH